MDKLARHNRAKVIDLLNERLTFERHGVKLYDRILAEMIASGDGRVLRMLEQMRQQRREEKEHAEWLEEQIREIGGDAHAATEHSRLVETEAKGIEEIILTDHRPLGDMFHALLAAELSDNAGWDLLVDLADEAGDKEARKQFKKRLRHEEEHLSFVRKAVERFTVDEVLAADEPLPRMPAP